jgi:hypothetical protein
VIPGRDVPGIAQENSVIRHAVSPSVCFANRAAFVSSSMG